MAERGESVFGIQCTVCEWRAVANEHSRAEISRRAIDHYLENGSSADRAVRTLHALAHRAMRVAGTPGATSVPRQSSVRSDIRLSSGRNPGGINGAPTGERAVRITVLHGFIVRLSL